MLLRSSLSVLMVALFAALSGGCAAAGTGAAGGEVAVRVQNNLIPPTTLTIYAVPETGARRLLGSVTPNSTQTFTFLPGAGVQHRFMARTTAGAEVVSNPVPVSPGATVRWDVQSNVAAVVETP